MPVSLNAEYLLVILLLCFTVLYQFVVSLPCVLLAAKVPSLGAVVEYTDGPSEPLQGIVIKHFDDKCSSILVDKKTHHRRLVSSVLCVSSIFGQQV